MSSSCRERASFGTWDMENTSGSDEACGFHGQHIRAHHTAPELSYQAGRRAPEKTWVVEPGAVVPTLSAYGRCGDIVDQGIPDTLDEVLAGLRTHRVSLVCDCLLARPRRANQHDDMRHEQGTGWLTRAWKTACRCSDPPKVRVFAWKLVTNAWLTIENKVTRKLKKSDIFLVCVMD